MKTIWMMALAGLVCSSHALAQDGPVTEAATPAATAPAVEPAAAVIGNIAPPPAGKGQVIFFRKGGLVGAAISCATHENGQKLSSLPPGRYHVHIAEPGIHEYSVKSEATDTLRMEVEPGETYFAKCAIGMGIMAGRPNLSPSDAATFSGMYAKLKPAVNKVADASK